MGKQEHATFGQPNEGNGAGGDQTADNPFKESNPVDGEIPMKRQILRSYEETSYGRAMSQ